MEKTPRVRNDLLGIHHDGSPRYVRPVHGPAGRDLEIGDEIELRLRVPPGAPIERILLRLCPDGEQRFLEMEPLALDAQSHSACRWWTVHLRLEMPVTTYRFLFFSQDGPFWLNAAGIHWHLVTDAEDFRLLAGYKSPAWVREAVFYQIFPDRFADGDPSNNVQDGEIEYRGYRSRARRWGEPPAAKGWEAMAEFYGGDLAGIGEKIPYLLDLGVNALYLNPIFSAYSNHRYDVVDYYNVDPHLGGNAALIDLRQKTAAQKMRLILDIVPNHCGVLHPWFQAAQQDAASASSEFFTFFNHPDQYATWLGVSILPKFDYRSSRLRDVMYAGPDAIFRHWLRLPYSVDGWRIDVANMLGRQGADQLGVEVGRGIRQAVKEENPDAYLLGENFFDASSQLQGDLWDAVMNYAGFSIPLWFWLSGFTVDQHGEPRAVSASQRWSTEALVRSWQSFRAAIPWAIAAQQFNLLGSHDTDRILSRVQLDPHLNRLAVGIQFTVPGVPCIYYGDEIGLKGEGNATRACMPWDPAEWDGSLRSFYRQLINLRRTSPALISGGFQVLVQEEETLAFVRDSDEEWLLVVGQRGPGTRSAGPLVVWPAGIPDATEFVEFFSDRRSQVKNGDLPLPPVQPGLQIWRSSRFPIAS